jgi:tetratricopeptide (TPR) repeat protein
MRTLGLRSVVLAVAITVACTANSAAAFKVLKEGEKIPAFSVPGPGGAYDNAWLAKNKATLLIFWASWSPRSKEALEGFVQLHREFGDKGLSILAMNVEGEKVDAARQGEIDALLATTPLPFPVAFDKGLVAYQSFGVMVVPSVALVDPSGKVTYEFSSYMRDSLRETTDKVRELLGTTTPTPTPAVVWAGGRQPEHRALLKYNMGARMAGMGMTDQAITGLREAAEIDPLYADPHILIGKILLSSGDLGGAVDSLRKAVSLDPSSKAAHVALAGALLEKKDVAGAKTEIAALSGETAGAPDVLALQGRVLEAGGDLKGAAEAYRKALERLLIK